MRKVAIVQARIGSTRLPGKTMLEIAGRPMLWHVVNRLSFCEMIDFISVAIPDTKKDDVIYEYCRDSNMDVFRGSENDVLDRYYKTALHVKADIVIRITSDCPLIDPVVTDKVISAYINAGKPYDGASNVVERTYPRGLDTEVLSMKALEDIWRLAKDAGDREHVTKYMYEDAERFQILNVKNDTDLSRLRWTVDEERDLKFVREVYKHLYKEGQALFLMDDILKLLGTKELDAVL